MKNTIIIYKFASMQVDAKKFIYLNNGLIISLFKEIFIKLFIYMKLIM